MKRVLTGIQSSGKPHLGNLLGAIVPAIRLSEQDSFESFFFIADLHSLTTIKNGDEIRANVQAVAAAWLACGFNIERNFLYRQSHVPEVCELAWYLNCFTPYPMLANAHSFKDKADRLSDVNAGLFTYPVLMAADIILYDAHIVPVGKDQRQHVEMTRDIATSFNHQFGETFVVPEAKIEESVMTIPGTDGQKMSKSYGNTIDIFQPDKALRKQVMSIVTDSLPLESPKDPEKDTVFALYTLVATPEESQQLADRYRAGNFGYGHAKEMLFDKLCSHFARERELFNHFMDNPAEIDTRLQMGEAMASTVAQKTLERVREKLGF